MTVSELVSERVAPCRSTLSIAATGYLSSVAGSVAGANSLVLRELLAQGHRVSFHSKPNFVDPRPIVAGCQGEESFSFVDCTNGLADRLHQSAITLGRLSSPLKPILGRWDDSSYRRRLVSSLSAASEGDQPPNVGLWLGTWSSGSLPTIPTVSWAQGPPGTDARSIEPHAEEIAELGGRALLAKLRLFARWRLGPGLPNFAASDQVIVGSRWSVATMQSEFGADSSRLHSLPYPIDLDTFTPPARPRSKEGPLHLVWLGRFVPRKRLGLFLDGIALAIQQGVDVKATVIGQSGFVPNYERLLESFPYSERLHHQSYLPREEVPALFANSDVLAQPSDEENFGSSVAEGQACGMPTIIGATNGTGEYTCERSIRLADDRVETFAEAVATLAEAKRSGALADPTPCRLAAERHYSPESVAARLEEILASTIGKGA